MKEIHIDRRAVESATWSKWRVAGHTFHGIEQPWRDNLPYHSCIPPGIYTFIPWNSPTHGSCFAFVGGSVALSEEDLAPPTITRFACLAHVANYAHDVEGCSGLGMSKGRRTRDNIPAVWRSGDAMRKLKRILGSDPYHIAYVRWAA